MKSLGFFARVSPKDTSRNYSGSSVQLTSFNNNGKFKKTFNIIVDMNLIVHKLEITPHES